MKLLYKLNCTPHIHSCLATNLFRKHCNPMLGIESRTTGCIGVRIASGRPLLFLSGRERCLLWKTNKQTQSKQTKHLHCVNNALHVRKRDAAAHELTLAIIIILPPNASPRKACDGTHIPTKTNKLLCLTELRYFIQESTTLKTLLPSLMLMYAETT